MTEIEYAKLAAAQNVDFIYISQYKKFVVIRQNVWYFSMFTIMSASSLLQEKEHKKK